MSLKACIAFQVQLVGDGSDTTISINMATAPIIYQTGGSNNTLSPLFSAQASGVSGLSEQTGSLEVTAVVWHALTKTVDVSFASAPANGTVYTLLGTLEF